MPRAKKSPWNGDSAQSTELRLAMAKKAALKSEKPKTSWWTESTSREDFQKRLAQRHAEILNSASASTRSIHRAI